MRRAEGDLVRDSVRAAETLLFVAAVPPARYLATLRLGAPLSPAFDPEAGRVGSLDRGRAPAWLASMGLAELLRVRDA